MGKLEENRKKWADLQAEKRARREGGRPSQYFAEELKRLEKGGETFKKGVDLFLDAITKTADQVEEEQERATLEENQKLDAMSKQELQILSRHTQLEIEDAEARLASITQTHERQQQQSPGAGLAHSFNKMGISAGRDYLLNKKKLLAAIEVRLEAPEPVPAVIPAKPQLSKEEQKLIRAQEKKTEHQRVRATISDPQILKQVDEMYRKALDEILDS